MTLRLLLFDALPLQRAEYDAAFAMASPARRAKATSYVHARDRELCIMAEALLAYSLGLQPAEMPAMEIGANGKPRFAYPSMPHFSISHCRQAVACAIAGEEIGVDVELSSSYSSDLALEVCSADEVAAIGGSAVKFTKLWTRKESLLKCRGTGLCDDLPGVLADTAGMHFATFSFPKGYSVSVCSRDDATASVVPEFLTFKTIYNG